MDLTEILLRKLYLEDLLTEKQIAQQFALNQVHVNRLRKKWNIPTLGKTGRAERTYPPITQEQQEILIGSLLGDGSMDATSTKAARFSEGHSIEQAAYLDWKMQKLNPYVSSIFSTEKVDANGKHFPGRGFSTHSCPQLLPYHQMFYATGKRVFPKKLHTLMTPMVLAVWYMDDGNLCNGFHPRIAFGLDEDSLKAAVKALRALHLKPEIYSGHNALDIIFPGQSHRFFDIIRPHVPECMAYKLPIETKRRDQDLKAKRVSPQSVKAMYEGV